jgi:hypothetical protein
MGGYLKGGRAGRRLSLIVFLVTAGCSAATSALAVDVGFPPLSINGGVGPKDLPAREPAAVSFRMTGSTPADSAASLRRATIEFDRNAAIDPGATPICRRHQIEQAEGGGRSPCPASLVGSGTARLVAGSDGMSVTVPLNAFNGGRAGGAGLLFVVPAVTSLTPPGTIATVRMKRIRRGRFGLEAVLLIRRPDHGDGRLAAFGVTLNRRGYVMAKCPDGHLSASVESYEMSDGTRFSGDPLSRSCVPTN